MDRIAIIGNGGGGKSTLSRQLSARLGVPWYEIDQIQWKPGWIHATREEFDRSHQIQLREPRWIIDGFGPPDAMAERFRLADTVIWVDFPLWIHLWWAAKRQIKAYLGHEAPPPGCTYRSVSVRMFRAILRVHRDMRPMIASLVQEGIRVSGGRLVHLRSPRAWRAFVRSVDKSHV